MNTLKSTTIVSKLNEQALRGLSVAELSQLLMYSKFSQNITALQRKFFDIKKDITVADNELIERVRMEKKSGTQVAVGFVEEAVFSKGGELEWSKEKAVVKYPTGVTVEIKNSAVPMTTPKKPRPGQERLVPLLCGLFHITQGELVKIQNRASLEGASFSAFRISGMVAVYKALKEVLGIDNEKEIGTTRKGFAFYQYLSEMCSSCAERDYMALMNLVCREFLNVGQVKIVGSAVHSTKGVTLGIYPTINLSKADKKALQAAKMFPPLYLAGKLSTEHLFMSAEGASAEGAVKAVSTGGTFRGSSTAGSTGLMAGWGFSGMPSVNTRYQLTLLGLLRDAGTRAAVTGFPPSNIPFVVEASAYSSDELKFVIKLEDIHNLPTKYRPYCTVHFELPVTQKLVDTNSSKEQEEDGQDDFDSWANIFFCSTAYSGGKIQEYQEKFRTIVDTVYEQDSVLIFVGILWPNDEFFADYEEFNISTFRPPYDAYGILANVKLEKFGDHTLKTYESGAEWFKAIVLANRCANSYFLAPAVHFNSLSNALVSIKDVAMLTATGEWVYEVADLNDEPLESWGQVRKNENTFEYEHNEGEENGDDSEHENLEASDGSLSDEDPDETDPVSEESQDDEKPVLKSSRKVKLAPLIPIKDQGLKEKKVKEPERVPKARVQKAKQLPAEGKVQQDKFKKVKLVKDEFDIPDDRDE